MARHVVGGAPERVREQSLPSEAIAEIVQATTGGPIERVAASELPRGAVGGVRLNRDTNRPIDVRIRRDLTDGQFDGVSRHETGHILDEISGQIDTKGLSRELDPLYHYGVEGRERANNFTLPKHQGYSSTEAPREQMAEAIRQYMNAPDTMKAMAPKNRRAHSCCGQQPSRTKQADSVQRACRWRNWPERVGSARRRRHPRVS